MKRKIVVGCAAFLFAVAGIVTAATTARSECKTQGALALAMAQLLGVADEKTTPLNAADALKGLGIEPTAGWRLNECIAEDVVIQVDTDLKKAIADKIVAADKSAVVLDALQAIGAAELTAVLAKSYPEKAFVEGVHVERGKASPSTP